jgi:hypothetical protein
MNWFILLCAKHSFLYPLEIKQFILNMFVHIILNKSCCKTKRIHLMMNNNKCVQLSYLNKNLGFFLVQLLNFWGAFWYSSPLSLSMDNIMQGF